MSEKKTLQTLAESQFVSSQEGEQIVELPHLTFLLQESFHF